MWQLAGTHVALNDPRFRAELDLARPSKGLQNIVLPTFSPPMPTSETNLLRVHFAGAPTRETVEDCWIRGNDLCARFGETPSRPFFPEIYWRLIESSQVASVGLELIVSARTSRMDAYPTTWVGSRISAEEVIRVANPYDIDSAQIVDINSIEALPAHDCGLVVGRPPHANYSYVEMVFPGDLTTLDINREGQQIELRWRLFTESLEKGVIRRARLREWLVPRDHDLNSAVQHFQEFIESGLPLTT